MHPNHSGQAKNAHAAGMTLFKLGKGADYALTLRQRTGPADVTRASNNNGRLHTWQSQCSFTSVSLASANYSVEPNYS